MNYCGDHPIFDRIRRQRFGRLQVHLRVSEQIAAVHPLAIFRPSAIRQLAPEGLETLQGWREHQRKQLEMLLTSIRPSMIETELRWPIYPSSGLPYDPDEKRAVLYAHNSRFRLKESDIQHMIALHTRLHQETVLQMLKTLDSAQMDQPGAASWRSGLRLAVDNTRVRS